MLFTEFSHELNKIPFQSKCLFALRPLLRVSLRLFRLFFKVLSNSSLCLQRLRGRLPELVEACDDTLRRIRQIRSEGGGDQLLLLRMEAASRSRRGSAYAQQRRAEESAEDASRVKELLEAIKELEKAQSA